MTNKLNLKESWNVVKEKIKEAEISLSDKDLDLIPGKEEILLDRLSGKLHKTTDEVRQWIESISSNSAKAG